MALDIAWAAQPGSQYEASRCPIPELLYEGTRGPGKTSWLLTDFVKHVGRGYGAAWRGILFRESYPQLTDVVTKSKALFRQVWPEATYNESTHTWKFPDGEELLLRHIANADGYWNYHGHEYPWIGWEELTNWPNLDAYDAMKACWRTSTPGIPKRYASTANPFGIGHSAVKSYFVDPAPAGTVIRDALGNPRVRLHGHWSENAKLLAADPDYPRRLAADRNTNRRKAWFNGSWDVVAGGFFDDVWDERFHVLPAFTVPESWRVDRAFDWGSAKPFSVGWWAESDGTPAVLRDGTQRTFPRGSLFRIAEWYGWNDYPNEGIRLSSAGIAKGILEREARMGYAVKPGPADSSIYDVDVDTQKSIGDTMAEHGVQFIEADKSPGSRKNGWDRMRQMLTAATEAKPEEPGLWIFDGCRQFIRTVPILPRDELKPEDINTKAEDHIADETRYRVLARRHTMTVSQFRV